MSGDLGLEGWIGPGSLGRTRSPKVLSRGMIRKCIGDRLDFLEILQSGDTSIQELNCALKRAILTSDRSVCACLGAVMVPF